MKLLKWLAGFFEDQGGSASSKRAAMYIALAYLGIIINASTNGKPIDEMVLFSVVGIVVASMGLSTSEFFSPIRKDENTNP